MSDLISRQAAIDALEEYAYRLQMVNWKENPGVPYKAYALNWCINTIRDLPAAQPQRIKSIWADGRCLRCGEHAPFHPMASAYYESNFCPNCGAWMLEEPYKGEQG